MKTFSGDDITDKKDVQGTLPPAARCHGVSIEPADQVVATGVCDHCGTLRGKDRLDGFQGCFTVEDEAVDRSQVTELHSAVEVARYSRTGFRASQVMHQGKDGTGGASSQPSVQEKEGGMIQLVLDQYIQAASGKRGQERGGEVVGKIPEVAADGQGEDDHPVPAALQVLDEHAVVEVAAGHGVEGPVDDEPDIHGMSRR